MEYTISADGSIRVLLVEIILLLCTPGDIILYASQLRETRRQAGLFSTMSALIENRAPSAGTTEAAGESGGFVFRTLTSLGFALWIVTLLALACLVGTLLPQGEQIAGFMAKYPEAQVWMRALTALGFTHVFSSWWFVTLLGFLAASLAACSARRYLTIRRCSGAKRVRVIGSFLAHVSMLLILMGGVIRVVWGEKGMIAFREGETVAQFDGGHGVVAFNFAVHLAKFELELYETSQPTNGSMGELSIQWPEKRIKAAIPVEIGKERSVSAPDTDSKAEPDFRMTVTRYVPDFMIDSSSKEVKSRSSVPRNPAIEIKVDGGGQTHTEWLFAKFPDFSSHGGAAGAMPLRFKYMYEPPMPKGGGSIKAFRSSLQFIDGGKVVKDAVIAVNSPVTYKGYTFYQSGYNPEDLAWTSLQVVRDPGVPLVYGGFILMMVGLTVVFCIGPWMDGQRKQSGETT